MEKIIYLKFDELYLKGNNYQYFKQKLINNINDALIGIDYKMIKNYDNLIIEKFLPSHLSIIKKILRRIPGISYFTIAYRMHRDIQTCSDLVLNLLKNYNTFKIETKRIDKKYEINSDQFKRIIANYVLQRTNIKVDVHHPEVKVKIEITNNNFIVFTHKIDGAKGLPVGASGKVLMLLSGGIDSPVASDLLLRRGMHVDFLTFMTPPYTNDEALIKVKHLVDKITLNYRLERPKLFICNYTNIQNELSHIDYESYRITLLRRSFVRIANKIADLLKYDAIATGDSLGQVASQTIDSLNVINEASVKLILRPLICLNKEEIIKHAKLIDTYNISILPHPDACSLFAPKNPVTKPKLEVAKMLEEKISLLTALESNTIDNIEVISYDKK